MLKKVNIVGWYDRGNVGDESFRTVLSRELSRCADVEFTNLPNPSADLIIYGGGGVLNTTTLRGLRDIACPKYALGVDLPTSGPVLDTILEAGFTEFWCRSREYSWILKKERGLDVQYAPDLAFLLYGPKTTQPSGEKAVLGVILTPELDKFGGVEKHIRNALLHFKDQFHLRFISLYSGNQPNDDSVNQRLARDLGATDLRQPKTVDEALLEISQCSLLWTMRFHGLIFATLLGVPALGLANKGKFSQFVEQENLHRHWVELGEVTDYKLIRSASNLMNTSGILTATASKNYHALDSLFDYVRRTWLSHKEKLG